MNNKLRFFLASALLTTLLITGCSTKEEDETKVEPIPVTDSAQYDDDSYKNDDDSNDKEDDEEDESDDDRATNETTTQRVDRNTEKVVNVNINEYENGTYRATSSYVSPAGTDNMGVELTVKDDKITAVSVTPMATDDTSLMLQQAFAAGISGAIVGKNLDDVSNPGKIGGASLTAGGFAKAIAKIKEQASS